MRTGELEHRYGPKVHILDSPVLATWLARIGSPETPIPELRPLLRHIYEALLLAAIAGEFPTREAEVPTRMMQVTEHGVFRGRILDRSQEVVIACLVRAGVLPSEICYEVLCRLLDPSKIRIDYLSMSRSLDAEGRVTGTKDSGLKIGGPIKDAVLLIPDPMGATGGTVARTLEIYRELDLGPARKTLALPMISTPEFFRRLIAGFPDLEIYTGRLDRGLSPPEALSQPPGTHPEERGLTDNQYIVPGAGGVGEVLTNAWV